MLADIESGAIGTVVVWHLDRLHRQPRELEHFITVTDDHRVKLASVTGDVDLGTPQGRLIARIMGSVARAEVEHKSERQKAANRQRSDNGKAWVIRIFGYDGNKIVKREADAIRKACAELLNGASLWSIAKAWNEAEIMTTRAGTTSRSGKVYDGRWSGGTVRQVLVRPRNAGLQTYDGEVVEGVETDWPAIVSRDTWDAVCRVLADPKRHTGKRRARVHLLSGLAVCGLCGRKMGTTGRKTKRGEQRMVYQCKNVGCMKVVRDLVRTDDKVIGAVTRRLARPDAAKIFAKPTVDTKALTAQADEYRALITAAETDFDEGIITGRDLQRRRDTLGPKLSAIEDQLVGANTSRKLNGLIGNPKAAQLFAKLSLDRQRAVIDTVCTVTIEPNEKAGAFDPNRIRIDWK